MTPPTIAVVIPNRNDAGPLRKCLDSVLGLEVPPDEIVVVDDRSSDDSVQVIREMIRNVPTAKLIVNAEWLGTMGALNEGMHNASSDYVLFLSSNDYLEDGIFSHAKNCIQRDGYPGVWSALVSAVDEDGRNKRLYPSPVISIRDCYLSPQQSIRLSTSIGHWFTGTTLIYHREALKSVGGFDTSYQGLADMLAALTLASIKGASFSPVAYGVMRQHSGGLMWRTLVDLPSLDIMLDRMAIEGKKLSPTLFTARYCDLMRRRIRFTAIRAFGDASWLDHARSWPGRRYRLLVAAASTFGRYRKPTLLLAILLLRPLYDSFNIIRFRWFGVLLLKLKLLNQMQTQPAAK